MDKRVDGAGIQLFFRVFQFFDDGTVYFPEKPVFTGYAHKVGRHFKKGKHFELGDFELGQHTYECTDNM
jgi:hypothetical protein